MILCAKVRRAARSAAAMIVVLSALAAQTASAANIVWVSDNPTAVGFYPPFSGTPDDAFVMMLTNAGHNVIRYSSADAAATLLSPADIAALNTNDLIIVGRAVSSTPFQGAQGAQWNTNITKPLMMQSSFLVRGSRLGWFSAESSFNGTPTPLTLVNPADPATAHMFQGVALSGSTTVNVYDEAVDQNTSQTLDAVQGGGTVLATGSGSAKVIVSWPAGAVVKGGANTLAGYRLYFASGSREVSGGAISTAGKENLTPTGEGIWMRAVEIALNNGNPPPPPTAPVITNQPQSLTVTQGTLASFTVGADGAQLAYHWHFNDAPIPGVNSRTFSLPSASPADAGNYFVIVSNAAGSATSDVVTLTVEADIVGPVLLSAVGNAEGDAIVLTYSEPLEPSVGAETGNYSVFRVSDNQELFIFSATLLNPSTVVLTNVSPRIVGENYIVQLLDIQDRFGNIIDPNPTIMTVRTEVVVVQFDVDNDWKYEISGADLTTSGWQAPGYNDSNWSFGPAPLGLDVSAGTGVQPAIRTTLPYDSSKLTTYFRKRFQLPGTPAGGSLKIRHVVEDGAVYYLNGAEIFRHRMPLGAIAYNTTAGGAPDPTPVEGPFTIPVTNLVEGENVLAVSVHQSGLTSTDLEFTAEVTATVAEYIIRPPIIVAHPQSQTVVETAPATLDVTLSQGTFLTYQWYFNSDVLPGATNRAIQYASTHPSNQGTYFLIASNATGMATSDVATLTVLMDTNAPVVRSVRAPSLDTVIVIFSEAVDPISAATAANYGIADGNGNCCLAATTATLSNSTAVILTMATPLTGGLSHTARVSNITDRASSPNVLAFAEAPVQMPGSQSGNIVWVSDNPAANGFSAAIAGFDDDVFVTNFLQRAGYNVIRYSSDNAATNLMSPADIAALNTNDLIIVSRSTGSGAFNPPQGSQWNTNISTPMIVMSAYLLRSNHLGWFFLPSAEAPPDDIQTTLTMTNLASPEVAYLFQDVALRGNTTIDPYDHPLDRNTTLMTSPTVPGGEVIATGVQLGATAIADFPAGTAVRGGTELLAGYRMFFAGGSRETATVSTAGKDNLTPTGEAIFLRAVQLAMNDGNVPTPVSQQPIINLTYLSGSFSGSIQTANGVTYEVQYKDDLNASMWNTLTTISGDGTLKTFTDPGPATGARFYQVIIP